MGSRTRASSTEFESQISAASRLDLSVFSSGIGYRLSYSELACNIFLFKKWEISGNIFKKSIYIYSKEKVR